MGCNFCVQCVQREEEVPEVTAKYSWQKKDRVDRSLLVISDQTGGVVGRLPGQLNGRQFKIKQCQSATILVLDCTDSVTVENCVDCQILVGPTRGSLYVRECSNCQLVVACQQFRARDCKKCSVSLFSSTRPVIESSTKLKFSCFQCNYPQLKDQFQRIGESVFNNSWSKVHDFDGSLGETNWSIIPEDSHPLISLPTEGEFSQVGVSLAAETSAVPVTVGMINRPDGDLCIVVFFEKDGYEDRALEFAHKLCNKAAITFTKKLSLESQQAEELFPQEALFRANACTCSIIVLEVCGEDSGRVCRQVLEVGASTDSVYLSSGPMQGLLDSQALSKVMEISLTM